jgi:tetratricopeptide (TPR) repeat protein
VPSQGSGREQFETARGVISTAHIDQKPPPPASRTAFASLLDKATKYWTLMVALASLTLTLVAWVGLGVSPLEGAKEIAQRIRQRENQQELAGRHIQLGNDFLNVGQPEAAEADFKHAKELDVYNEDADLGLLKASILETVMEKNHDPEIVERRIRAVLLLKHHENDTQALAYMGDVLSNVDPEEAMSYYDKALASDHKNAWAYYGKGVLEETLGDRDTALQMYEKAVAISPWNQSFLNNAAYQHLLKRDYPTAEKLYVRVLNLQPDFLPSYCYLANAELMMGNAALADRNLEPLDERLHDESIMKLTFNQGTWMTKVRNQTDLVYMSSSQEKITYLRYLLAQACPSRC